MKRPISWPRYLGASALLVLLLPPVWLALTADEQPVVRIAMPAPDRAAYQVYVVAWSYHTAIILEQPRGWTLGPRGEERAPFVEYAWGDRRFYMESNFWPHAVFAALFLPTASVTYVAGRSRPPAGGFRSMHVRTVSGAELMAIAVELEASIARAADGTRQPPYAPVADYSGRFYPGVGRYLWWTDCNRWTVDRLAATGLARAGRGVIFSAQVAPRLIGFRAVPKAT